MAYLTKCHIAGEKKKLEKKNGKIIRTIRSNYRNFLGSNANITNCEWTRDKTFYSCKLACELNKFCNVQKRTILTNYWNFFFKKWLMCVQAMCRSFDIENKFWSIRVPQKIHDASTYAPSNWLIANYFEVFTINN